MSIFQHIQSLLKSEETLCVPLLVM